MFDAAAFGRLERLRGAVFAGGGPADLASTEEVSALLGAEPV